MTAFAAQAEAVDQQHVENVLAFGSATDRPTVATAILAADDSLTCAGVAFAIRTKFKRCGMNQTRPLQQFHDGGDAAGFPYSCRAIRK